MLEDFQDVEALDLTLLTDTYCPQASKSLNCVSRWLCAHTWSEY